MKNKIVVKDNAMVEAKFNLSLVEQRVMLLAMTEAREIEGLTCETPVEIRIKSYIDQFNVSSSTAYETVYEACRTLKRREFTYLDRYKGNLGYTTAGWVNKITDVPDVGCIVIYLSTDVISMISRLDEQFTQYYLDQVSDFKSKYSIRLYEIVIKWLSVGKTNKVSTEELRGKLGVLSTEYKTMSLFKTNVLDKAVKEINAKTNITIEYKQFKEGKTISHFSFHIKRKNNTKAIPGNEELFLDLTDKQINLFAYKLASDSDFGQKWADIGEEREDFEKRLKIELKDQENCKKYANDLIRVGYKSNSQLI